MGLRHEVAERDLAAQWIDFDSTGAAGMGRTVHHLITEAQNVGLRICHGFDSATAAHVATAYLTRDGLAAFEDALQGHLDRGGKTVILVGTWDYVTDPRALRRLLKHQTDYPNTGRRGLEVRLAAGFGFHWKLALFSSHTTCAAIVGSSNLTGKGTSSQGEINLEVRGSRSVHEELRKSFLLEFAQGRPLDGESLGRPES